MNPNLPYQNTLKLPVVAAPMFLISGPQLVIECCNNGVVGTFPALNNRSTEGFEEWLVEIKSNLAKNAAPYGVNLIVHPTNPRLEADLEVCIKHKVPIIITSLGAASKVVDAVHSYGGIVYHDIIQKRHGEKAAAAGVDGLICVSAGAGGHAGTVNPIALVNEIRSFWDKTLLLAGCISSGRDVATAIQMGADLAYLGTRFINTIESRAHENYQKMIIKSKADDIVYTAAVSGVSANFLKESLADAGFTQEMMSLKKKIDFGNELDAEKAEKKAWKSIWSAGQGVTNITDVLATKDLIERLKREFDLALKEQSKLIEQYN
jgi:nitronate monooxygenase